MPAQDHTLLEALEGPSLTVYGNRISGFNLFEMEDGVAERSRLGRLSLAEDLKAMASIQAYRIFGGPCTRLPRPILLSVPGNGVEIMVPECDFAPGEVRKWTLLCCRSVVAMDPSHGRAEDLLEAAAARGIDGGVALEHPRYENGRVRADAHVWGRISVLGASAGFDHRFPVCIHIGQPCSTIWQIAFASLKVWYSVPNQICAELCVGEFGLEKCWDTCVAIPIGVSPGHTAVPGYCTCPDQDSQGVTGEQTKGCVPVTIEDGKACLSIPYAGDVRISVPNTVANGTVAEACVEVCKKFGVPVGAKVTVRVLGQEVACQSWGRCDC